jgi:hypothetical protein
MKMDKQMSPEALSAINAKLTFLKIKEGLEALDNLPMSTGSTGALKYLIDRALKAFGGMDEAIRVLNIEVEASQALFRKLYRDQYQREPFEAA